MDSGRGRSIADMTDMGWDLKLLIAHGPTAGGTPTGRDSRDGYPTLHIPGRLVCRGGFWILDFGFWILDFGLGIGDWG